MSYSIFEYKYISFKKVNFEININSDGIMFYKLYDENGSYLCNNMYQLLDESIEKIKNIINENEKIFRLNTCLKSEENSSIEENEFFFSNGKADIRICSYNMLSYYMQFPKTLLEIETIKDSFEKNMLLLTVYVQICNVLKGEKYNLTLSKFDDYEKTNEEVEKIRQERQKRLAEGLTETRKLEIQKELEKMSLEEIENEIKDSTKEINNVLTEILNNFPDEIDCFEEALYCTLGEKYVIETSKNIDSKIKKNFNLVINKLNRALEFCKIYRPNTIKYWEMERDFLFLDVELNGDEEKKKKLEQANKICEKNNVLYEEYEKLYKEAIKVYIRNKKEAKAYIDKLKMVRELINAK